MAVRSQLELETTQRKLALLEEEYQRCLGEKVEKESEYAQELTIRSLKRVMNRMKEEITRYKAHAKVAKP